MVIWKDLFSFPGNVEVTQEENGKQKLFEITNTEKTFNNERQDASCGSGING